jgi:hypothetical protein
LYHGETDDTNLRLAALQALAAARIPQGTIRVLDLALLGAMDARNIDKVLCPRTEHPLGHAMLRTACACTGITWLRDWWIA